LQYARLFLDSDGLFSDTGNKEYGFWMFAPVVTIDVIVGLVPILLFDDGMTGSAVPDRRFTPVFCATANWLIGAATR